MKFAAKNFIQVGRDVPPPHLAAIVQHFWQEVRNLREVRRRSIGPVWIHDVLQEGRVRQSCVCTGLGKFPDDKLLSGMCEALTETSSMANKRLMQVLCRHRVAVVS